MTMITQEGFEAYLKCPRKSHLISEGSAGAQSRFHEWQRGLEKDYKEAASAHIRNSMRRDDWCIGTPGTKPLSERGYCLIFDYMVAEPDVHARLHALELHGEGARMGRHYYCPIRFVSREKLTRLDKLLLAFDAFAFSRATGKLPAIAKIVHGHRYLTVKVALDKLYWKVRRLIEKMEHERSESASPPVVLNRHCAECQFQAQCHQIAGEKDDLSLLATISDKERKKCHEKGIFTVTQLSYAFRPRKSSAARVPKHIPTLKALAIRQNKIHVLGAPTMNTRGTPVYLDVESDLDRDFYYLIGMRTGNGAATAQYSLWADDSVAEARIWRDFVENLARIEKPQLIHYGSYETRFLKRLRARYRDVGTPAFLDELAQSALNLLSIIYAHVYFPTYSNGLKEVGQYLGCRWSENGASGLRALMWTWNWENSRDPDLKQKLMTYNAEDCEATQRVAEAFFDACKALVSENPATCVVNADSLKRDYPQRFGKTEFLLPEFQKLK